MRWSGVLSCLLAAALFAGASAQFNWKVEWAPYGNIRVNEPYPGFIATITYSGPAQTLFYTFDKDGKSEPATATPFVPVDNKPVAVPIGLVNYNTIGRFNATLRVYWAAGKTGGPFSGGSLPSWSTISVNVVAREEGARFPPSPVKGSPSPSPSPNAPLTCTYNTATKKNYRCLYTAAKKQEVKGTAVKPVRVGRNGNTDNANECECRKLCDQNSKCVAYTYKNTRYCTLFTRVSGWGLTDHMSIIDSCDVVA